MQSLLEAGSNSCALLFKTWKGIPNKTPFLLLSPNTRLWVGESPAPGKWEWSLSLCAPSGLLWKREGAEEPCWKLIFISLPSLHSSSLHTVYREFSQITAALLPLWIKAVQRLQGEKWDSKYEFPQQWQHKAIGRGAVNDSTSGQLLDFLLSCAAPGP